MAGRLRWLVVGVGDISTRRVLPAIHAQPESELRGIVTRSPEKAMPYGVNVYPNLEVALRDREIDAVYIATPVALHAPLSIAALQARRDVLCEKPMAMNYPEALDMVTVARDSRRHLGVAYYRRLYPKLMRAKALLAEKVIGQPVLIEANCHGWFAAGEGHRSWLLDPQMAGGGPLYDIASHRIDAMNYLFGKPARATGLLSNSVHRYAVEDNASVLIDYANGVRGYVDVRWHSRVDRDEMRIIGTDGEIRLSPLNGSRIEWPGGAEDLPAHDNVHYPLIDNFVRAVLHRSPLASSGQSALWTDWVTGEVTGR